MMKNDLSCEVVKDLLPGYIDGLSSEETRIAVKRHLSECEGCKLVLGNMMNEGIKKEPTDEGDRMLLKKIKKRLSRKTKVICAISAVVVLVVIAAFYTLFSIPIKNVDLSDVKASAKVYPVSELEKEAVSENGTDGVSSVKISAETDDNSGTFQVTVPSIDNEGIMITGDTLEKTEYVTTVSWSCPYFLREIKYDTVKNENSTDTLYVSGFKTTVLGNKAGEYQSKMINLEFRQINKIVFVDGEQEIVLWENK